MLVIEAVQVFLVLELFEVVQVQLSDERHEVFVFEVLRKDEFFQKLWISDDELSSALTPGDDVLELGVIYDFIGFK